MALVARPSSRGGVTNINEDLKERVVRLCERFPNVSVDRIVQALRDNGGHAGYAAADLRALSVDALQAADPEESEHVATLLKHQTVFKKACRAHFKKFDSNHNGTMERDEVVLLVQELCGHLGVEPPCQKTMQAFFEGSHASQNGVLTERDFPKFFESLLRYAFFMQHRSLVGTWRYKSDPNSATVLGDGEFTIALGKDYRLHYRSTRCQCPGSALEQAAHGLQGLGRPEVHGFLELCDGWLQADLKVGIRDPNRRGHWTSEKFLGVLRIRFMDGTTEKVITNFRTDAQANWGNDIAAKRHKSIEEERTSRCGTPTAVGGVLKCIAPQGVAYRRSPEFLERTDVLLLEGESVRILERHLDTHWVRTAGGWLPTVDPRGVKLLELLPFCSQFE